MTDDFPEKPIPNTHIHDWELSWNSDTLAHIYMTTDLLKKIHSLAHIYMTDDFPVKSIF